MPLKQQILEQLKTAMRSKDEIALLSLRLLHAEIKKEEIAKLKREDGLSDEEITAIIARQIKQRKDSIEQFTKGGRADLAEKEQKELSILQTFMPAQMSEEEIRAIAREVIDGGANGFGAVMGGVMQKVKGRADGGAVKTIIESALLRACFIAVASAMLFFAPRANATTAMPAKDAKLYDQLKGMIILKVESKGEAYYVHPMNQNLYSLGRPDDVFAIMREQGIGITNANLVKISVGSGANTLKGAAEPSFAGKHLGKIFLQVESKGEAWYIYPKDKKRYYLGRPSDAFNIMRSLGLGITNENFTRLTDSKTPVAPDQKITYNVGYRTYTFSITNPKEETAQIPVSFWYPTDSKPSTVVYKTVGDNLKPGAYTSSVAISPPIKQGAKPYPLVLFFHGAQTCGTQSVFFTEHLASKGYIVAAPDFPDDAPQCSSIGKKSASMLTFLLALQKLLKIDTAGMVDLLVENYRVPGASRILDALITLNDTKDSFLFNAIDKNKIAASGHSYGGETSLGLIGAHPDKTLKDARLKAALLLSAPVFPYSANNIATVTIPLMLIQGDDNDDLDEYGNARKNIYTNARGPKYYLKLGDNASHGTFFNGVCTPYPTIQECQKTDKFVQVINNYGTAFLNKYLNNDPQANDTLDSANTLLKVYEKNAP